MYRYVCTGRTNSTHKNRSQQYTQKLVTKVHTFWRPKVHTDLETKIHNYSRPVNTRRGRVSTSTGGRNNCYVKVLPVPVPDTTSTRTCFWTLGAKENIRERNYLKYGEVHGSMVPGYKLRTDN